MTLSCGWGASSIPLAPAGILGRTLAFFRQIPSTRRRQRVAALAVEEVGTAPAMPVRREVEARFGK